MKLNQIMWIKNFLASEQLSRHSVPGLTQTGIFFIRKWSEARNFGFRKMYLPCTRAFKKFGEKCCQIVNFHGKFMLSVHVVN